MMLQSAWLMAAHPGDVFSVEDQLSAAARSASIPLVEGVYAALQEDHHLTAKQLAARLYGLLVAFLAPFKVGKSFPCTTCSGHMHMMC